jgi:hypothetical protein
MTTVIAQQAIVTTAGTKLVSPVPYSQQVLITNRDTTNSVFLGPAGVTTTSGAEVKPGQNWANAFVDLPSETELWAIGTAATTRVDVSQVVAN